MLWCVSGYCSCSDKQVVWILEPFQVMAETDLRDWAASNKISSKVVDMLVKDGFNSMDAIVLLESEDFSLKMPRGQHKLLLNALQALRPQTTEEASDRGATVDWAATPVEACVSLQTTTSREILHRMRRRRSTTSINIRSVMCTQT